MSFSLSISTSVEGNQGNDFMLFYLSNFKEFVNFKEYVALNNSMLYFFPIHNQLTKIVAFHGVIAYLFSVHLSVYFAP